MNFPNITVLNASSRGEFFGENVRWKTITEIKVEGNITDLTSNNSNNIHNVIRQLESSSFGSNAPFYTSITVNNVFFGSGYVSNFESSPEGTDVNNKKYTATITVSTDSPGLQSLSNDGLGSVSKNYFKYIQNFSEESSFSKGEGTSDVYTQNISFTITPPNKLEGKAIAESIARSFLDSNQLTSLIQGVYQKTGIKKYYEQNYDDVTNTYSVNSRFELKPRSLSPGNVDTLIVSTNVRVDYTNDGIISITEEGECIGNKPSNRFNDAAAHVNNLINSAFSRLSGLIDDKHNPLIDHPVNKSFVGIEFEGRATYSVTFTNSKELIENQGYWSFNINIENNQGGDVIGTESGEILGVGEIGQSQEKFKKALALWSSKKNDLLSRIQESTPSIDGNFRPISFSETHSETDGKISYSYSFSNSSALFTSESQNGVTKKTVKIKEDGERKLFSTFNIINQKEIAQKQKNLLPEETTIDILLNTVYTTDYSLLISEANNIAIQNANNLYISNIAFSFSPSNRELNYTATYFDMPAL
jgi:hypothetical protein